MDPVEDEKAKLEEQARRLAERAAHEARVEAVRQQVLQDAMRAASAPATSSAAGPMGAAPSPTPASVPVGRLVSDSAPPAPTTLPSTPRPSDLVLDTADAISRGLRAGAGQAHGLSTEARVGVGIGLALVTLSCLAWGLVRQQAARERDREREQGRLEADRLEQEFIAEQNRLAEDARRKRQAELAAQHQTNERTRRDGETESAPADAPRAANAPQPAPADFKPVYSWVEGSFELQRLGAMRRVSARIVVPKGLDRATLEANVRHALHVMHTRGPADALWISIFREGDDTSGAFTVGKAIYAPGGEWSKAEARTPRTQFQVSLELADSYFATDPRPEGLKPSDRVGLFGTVLPSGSTLTKHEAADRAQNVDASETYSIDAPLRSLWAFFEAEMPKSGWKRTGPMLEDALNFRRGKQVIMVIFNRSGGEFILMGDEQ